MQPFTTHRGILAPLDRAGVDTDQIIPKQFLKSIARTGFEKGLFYDWRLKKDGTSNPDFELNAPEYKNASILITRDNFGCGSSREHAVWALMQYGFRVIIAPSFADIFFNNAAKNGLLLITLQVQDTGAIFEMLKKASEPITVSIDLPAQTLTIHDPKEIIFTFEINPSLKAHLIKGLDDIAITLSYEADIKTFESCHSGSSASA